MLKKVFVAGLGLLGSQGSWDGSTQAEADFSDTNFGGAGSLVKTLLTIPPFSNGGLLGANDSYPSQLAAAAGSRAIGAGSSPFATLLGLYLYTDNGGAVYKPSLTLTVEIISLGTGTTPASAVTVLNAFDISTITNFWTRLSMATPSDDDRVFSLTGTAPTQNPYLLYSTDVIQVTLTAGGAVDNTGKFITLVAEYA